MQSPRPSGDPPEIARAVSLLLEPDTVAELRVLNAQGGGTVSGYFDWEHREEFIRAAMEWSGKAPAVYFTLNPVDPVVSARSLNRVKRFVRDTTKDNEILRRCWFPIDFDPKRPAGISATDAEHEAAIALARECREYLRGLGWSDPILADSGNGAHLLYRIDLPNDQASTELIKRILESLATRFRDSEVDVDKSVFNAARIWKLYGTLSAKGDYTTERPHRIARILEVPPSIETVPIETLKAMLTLTRPPDITIAENREETFRMLTTPYGKSFDLESWIVERGLPIEEAKPWEGGLYICF